MTAETLIDYDKVICPNCVHQFQAIPVNVQEELVRLRGAISEESSKREAAERQSVEDVSALNTVEEERNYLRRKLRESTDYAELLVETLEGVHEAIAKGLKFDGAKWLLFESGRDALLDRISAALAKREYEIGIPRPKARVMHPLSCPDAERMGEHACENKAQCWEPCGELGKSEAHVRVASREASAAVDAALRGHAVGTIQIDEALVREIAMQVRHYEPICIEKVNELLDDIRQGIRLYMEERGQTVLSQYSLSTKPPSKPGFYWVRYPGDGGLAVIRVDASRLSDPTPGALVCWDFPHNGRATRFDGYPNEQGFLFSTEPLPEPKA